MAVSKTEYRRNWRHQNTERVRAQRRAHYHRDNKAEPKQRVENPSTGLRWKRNHPDKVRAYMFEWKRNNRLKQAEYEARRRAAKAGCYVEKVDYAAIIERDGLMCYLCDQPVNLETVSFDHVVSLADKGPHVASNIKVCHRVCNSKKHKQSKHGEVMQ